MKIKATKSNLLSALNIVSKAVPAKTPYPILECILVEVYEDKIKLTANDLELGIETILDGDVIEMGKIAIDAKMLMDTVRKFPESDIYIESTLDYKVIMRSEKTKMTILSKSGDDFSELPEMEKNKCISISQFTLKELIRQTIFSIGNNENNKMMGGELFEVNNGKLKVVGLDGHRIAMRNIELKGDNIPEIYAIVPGKSLIEISKIINGGIDDMVNVYFTDNLIMFDFDNTVVVSRLIEGEYFKISHLFSIDQKTMFTINKNDFTNAVDRSTLVIKESDKKPIVLSLKDDVMYLRADTIIGNFNEEIEIKKDGEDIIIGLNPRFLLDVLRVIDDEDVSVYMTNGKSPCVVKDKDESYVYVLLPININPDAYK